MILRRGPLFVAVSRGWFGVRWFGWGWRSSRYYVFRDMRLHRPLFSEREGHVTFKTLVRIGPWEFGSK